MCNVEAKEAYYIKLGRGGVWEEECFRDNIVRLSYQEIPHGLCKEGNWDAVWMQMRELRGDDGAATRDTNQIRIFYEVGDDALFITFAGGVMHWCRAAPGVEMHPSGHGRLRRTVNGWDSRSIGGKHLSTDRLSGNVLKKQRFQGTICSCINVLPYLLRKINDELSPEVSAAEEAEQVLSKAIIGLMRLLTWQDFELLVDLIFSNSGWRRVGVVGRTQKTVDLELLLPTTGERAFVQVKSQASNSHLRDYLERFAAADAYDRMFFVWHSGRVAKPTDAPDVTLVGPERLARMVLDAGLSSWLREKVS